jgi:hypothetical protein
MIGMDSTGYQLLALAITLVTEVAGMLGLMWLLPVLRARRWRLVVWVVVVNLVVHTLFWQGLARLPSSGMLTLWLLEGAVVVIEGICYWGFGRLTLPQALVISLLLNVLSYSLGVFVWLSGAF